MKQKECLSKNSYSRSVKLGRGVSDSSKLIAMVENKYLLFLLMFTDLFLLPDKKIK